MTIDEAVEILEEIARARSFTRSKEPTDAIKLGIEALKRVRDYKKAHFNLPYTPMPGETKEVGHEQVN